MKKVIAFTMALILSLSIIVFCGSEEEAAPSEGSKETEASTMAYNTIKRSWNMFSMVNIEDLRGSAFQDEDDAHTFEISGTDGNGNTIPLSGSVSAIFMRADNTDVAIVGSISGEKAYVTLPEECYDYPGRFGLTIYLTSGGQKVAIYSAVGSVHKTSSGTVSPGTADNVEDLIDAIEAAIASIPADYSALWTSLAPAFSASTSYASGQYVTYDGGVYRFVTSHSGSWAAADAVAVNIGGDMSQIEKGLFTVPTMTSGGFIRPSTPGDVVTGHARSSYSDYIHFTGDALVYTYLLENSTGIAVYDENKNFIKAYTGDGAAWYSISVNGGRYFRFTNDHVNMKDGEVKYILNIGDALIDRLDLLNEFLYAPGMTSGGFVKAWSPGDIVEHARSSYSDYIPLDGKVKVYTWLIENTSIGIYDGDKNYIRSITGNGAAWYDITTSGGKYFRISNDHINMSDAFVRCFYESGNPFVTPSLTSGGFVKAWSPGDIVEHARSSYSDYIPFNGEGDVFTYLIDGTSIGIYDSSKIYIRSITGSGAKWYNIDTQGGKYFRITNDHVYMDDSKVEYYVDSGNRLNDSVIPNLLSVYEKIVCCGDSLTWGAVYTAASEVRQAYKPYPAVLTAITGTETQNIGASGYSTSDWWSHYSNQLNQDALYIVFLGTNGGLTDTISTDCSGTDPSGFASTNTGSYGKILQTLKNNGKKAVLIHVYACSDSTVEITNSVINQFGQRFSFPVIELGQERTNAIYHYYPDGSGSNSVHFNDYGYCYMAIEINNLVNNLPNSEKMNIFPD